MEKKMYSQHDLVADFFNVVQVSDLDSEAFSTNLKRSIQLCKDPAILTKIADCELCYMGSYDDVTGAFNVEKKPRVILNCKPFVEAALKILNGSKN